MKPGAATVMSGTGNRFVVLDGLEYSAPERPAELARRLCAADVRGEPSAALDGVLLALPPRSGGDLRMVLHNADGSRPETCGNGLRCLGLWWALREDVARAELTVETDAGPSAVQVERTGDAAGLVHVRMAPVRVAPSPDVVRVLGRELSLVRVDVGNPHAVLLLEDLVETPVTELGTALQSHPLFPAGVNVEFASPVRDEVHVRVFERGVGETLACGSGACAVAAVVHGRRTHDWPVKVRMTGGLLTVRGDGDGGAWLSGPARVEPLESFLRARLEHALPRDLGYFE